MKELSIRYSFGITVLVPYDTDKRVYHNLSSTDYPMLSHLSSMKAEMVHHIITNLEAVIVGQQEQFGPWGEQFCMIQSTKETSHLEYYEYSDDNHWISGLTTEIPAPVLLNIMRGWLIFLTNNPRHRYATRKEPFPVSPEASGYGFNVGVMQVGNDKSVYHTIGMGNYHMLGYLRINEEPASREVTEALEKVITSQQEEYGPWGADFCVIDSYKDYSRESSTTTSPETITTKNLFIPTFQRSAYYISCTTGLSFFTTTRAQTIALRYNTYVFTRKKKGPSTLLSDKEPCVLPALTKPFATTE